MVAILGKKLGMTQQIGKEGQWIAATAIEVKPCVVTAIKKKDKHGYDAIQVGTGEIREKLVSKAYAGSFQKAKLPVKRHLREIRAAEQEKYELGQEIKVDIFKPGDLVDVQGTSIGKGFAGGMKKWGWGGGPKSHGSMFHRRIGSAGASSFPSRTWPGHHMPGRMGGEKKTVQNLEVLRVDAEKDLMILKGAVPGGSDALLYIRKSLKKPMGIKPKQAPKKSEKKDPLKASKQAAAGKKK